MCNTVLNRDAQNVLKNYQPSDFNNNKNGEKGVLLASADHSVFINYMYQKKLANKTLNWLNLFINLKIASGYLFIRFMLKKIELQKKLFLLELELGEETFIGRDLSLVRLPKSFHFYDGILNFIKDNISREKLTFYSLKQTMREQILTRGDVQRTIMEKFLGSENNLTFKSKVVNRKMRNEIDHTTSPHISGLQMSQYLTIAHGKVDDKSLDSHLKEKTISNQKQKYYASFKQETMGKHIKLPSEPVVRENFELRFCKEAEVNRKRHNYIMFKSTFAEKIRHLSLKGKRLDISYMIFCWINENIDMLYERLKDCVGRKSQDSAKEKAREMI